MRAERRGVKGFILKDVERLLVESFKDESREQSHFML